MDKELKKQLHNIEKNIEDVKTDIEDVKTDVAVNKTNIQEGFEKAEKERADLRKRIDKTYNIKKTVKEELGVDLF